MLRTSLLVIRLVSFIVGTSLTLVGTAQGQYWFDNFDDGSFDDGTPVTWEVDPQGFFPGEYSIADGDLVMFARNGDDDNESLAAWVDDVEFVGTASVRTRASLLNIPDVIDGLGNVGVALFFDPVSVSGYLGLMSVDSNLQLISLVGGVPEGLQSMRMDFSPADDIHIQLDHDGVMLSLTAWEVGARQPAPQFIVEHSLFENGKSGLIFNENSPNGAGVFRWARSQSSAILDGDLDLDGDADAQDIDTLFRNLGSDDGRFDVSEDGSVDQNDVEFLVQSIFQTNLGDANLDGIVSPNDLSIWHANIFQENTGWALGDFNGDQVTDVSDFNIWNAAWTGVPAVVPEPLGGPLLFLWACWGVCRRRR